MPSAWKIFRTAHFAADAIGGHSRGHQITEACGPCEHIHEENCEHRPELLQGIPDEQNRKGNIRNR